MTKLDGRDDFHLCTISVHRIFLRSWKTAPGYFGQVWPSNRTFTDASMRRPPIIMLRIQKYREVYITSWPARLDSNVHNRLNLKANR